MKHLRCLAVLLGFCSLVACGSVQESPPIGDDTGVPDAGLADPPPDADPTLPPPDAPIDPPPDASDDPPPDAPPPMECTVSADCDDPTRPYCISGTCEECNGAASCTADEPVCRPSDHTCGDCSADAQCAIYSNTPVCGPDGGCVECTANADCAGTTPICEANTCRACESGADCASGECHLDTGACYLPGELVYLSPGGNDANACTKTQKCATFARAVQLLTATKDTITLAPGVYGGGAVIPASVGTVEIIGHGATIQGAVETSADDAAFRDLTIDGGVAAPIRCQGTATTCTFERVSTNAMVMAGPTTNLIEFSSSGGLFGGGMVTIRRAEFTEGASGVYLSANFDVTNSVFARNAVGIFISGTGVAGMPRRFENNTVVDNGSPAHQGQVLDLKCHNGATATFRNNIVWSSFAPHSTSSVTSGCDQTYSLIYTGTSSAYPGTGNLLGTPSFVRLYPSGSLPADFHLTAGSICRDTADPANPLAEDIDGGPRPVGSRADIGADEYTP